MRKPRESKYQKMIGKKINEVYTDFQMNLESENYEITGYIPGGEPRISKSGRPYKVYKVQLENVVWISTQMFNKYVKRGYFSKNVHRKIDDAKMFESINNEFEPLIEVVKPVEVKEEPTKYEIELTSVMWRTKGKRTTEVECAINDMANIDSIPELKKYFKTECKKFHPDHGGNAEDFAEVRFWYEEELRNIESIQTALDEILNESVVKPVDELHDLKTTYNLKDLKNAYRVLARKFHPDNLETGDSDRFKLVKTIYDVRKLMIEEILEVFGYDDPNFAELVDMTEDLHKSLHKIVY